MSDRWYFCRAQDLRNSIPRVDLHLHTTYTDGRSTVCEYLQAAARKGIQAILFSEHADRTTRWFPIFQGEVQDKALAFPQVLALCGVEVRAAGFRGELNAESWLLESADLVMGVVHRYPDGRGGVHEISELTKEKAADLEYRAAMGLLDNSRVRILGHPGATFEKHFGEFPIDRYTDIIEKAIQRGVAIELNPAYQRNFGGFVRLCSEKNALVSIGSNAHSAEEIGRAIEAIRRLLRGQ